MPKVSFIGSVALHPSESGKAFSPAGQHVQITILHELRNIYGERNVTLLSMPPYSIRESHDKAKAWIPSSRRESELYFACLNLPFVKHLLFGVQLLVSLLRERPDRLFVWNCNFWQSAAIFLYKHFVRRSSKVALILQDSLPLSLSLIGLQRAFDRLALHLAWFHSDIVISVTKKLANMAWGIKHVLICPGGVADNSWSSTPGSPPDAPRFVFGGRLDPYNGPLDLISVWPESGEFGVLEVYGSGGLEAEVRAAAALNSKVRYFGYVSRDEFVKKASTATGVFVLRYSRDIDQELFFPSKFLEACLLPVPVICNRFANIPRDIEPYCFFVRNDISNLSEILREIVDKNQDDLIRARRDLIIRRYTWRSHMVRADEMLSEAGGR